MGVGATRIQLLHEKALGTLAKPGFPDPLLTGEPTAAPLESCGA